MSSDLAIKVDNISKCYHVFDAPRDRLKQFIVPRAKRMLGLAERNYFREFWALDTVSFEVKKGEAVGILGRNGSGKSTLLQMICGTLNPTSGSIMTNGRIAALLELGSGFNPEFTGRENIYLNGSLLGLSRDEIDARFDKIAAFADIGEHIEQPVKTYSSGMVVRLAFAVQVQVEPDILIVDEALAVGDWLFQKRCFQKIEQLVSNGTTLLFVSHDQESVRTLTNRALLLDRGKQVSWGVSSEVILEYRKILHAEESAYFGSLIPTKAEPTAPSTPEASAEQPEDAARSSRSEQLSFGEGEAQVVRVQVLNSEGEEASVFYPGDPLLIRVHCKAFQAMTNLNVGLRLRNKEGVKIYSWGTLNQDMFLLETNTPGEVFWRRHFEAGEEFSVDFLCDCPLGMNLYEVQAAVSLEETSNYLHQRILHWVDEAAFFQVVIRRDTHFFGGTCDMRMTATWP